MATEPTREEVRAQRKEEKRRAKLGLPPNSNEVAEPSKKKTKQRETTDGLEDELVVTPIDVEVSLPSEESKKSKKRKHREEVDATTQPSNVEPGEEKPKKSKKRKQDAQEDTPMTEEPESKLKSSEKSNTTEAAAKHAAEGVDASPLKTKKKKKSKEGADNETADSKSSVKKDKKTAVKEEFVPHNFTNPTEDETLPEASSKSLIYAYQYAERHNPAASSPEEWKFSKARQNWLTRHIWYEDAVPDGYVDLVITYLKSVQGGARDAIIKGCQIILNPLPPATESPVVAADGNAEGTATATPSRKVKFAESEPAAEASKVDVATDPAEARRIEVRRARAVLLRDALQ